MARKRHSTWGSNEPAGKGRRRLRWWADMHDGRGYRRCSKTIDGTRRDGDEELARIRASHAHDMASPTLQQAFEAWWEPDALAKLAEGSMARSTYDNYMSRWRRHVRPAFGDVPVADIRPLAIQEWLLGLTASMASLSLMLLRQVLDLCVRYEALDHNQALGRFRMPTRSERSRPRDVYDLAALTRALEAVRGTAAYVPAVLCGLGSCRTGESLGVRADLGEVRRVDAGGMAVAVVDVVRQVDAGGNVGADGALKNAQSVRPVAIPEPWSLDVLAAAEAGGRWLTDNGLGEPLSQTAVRRIWRESLEAAGVGPIPFANLRSSWRTVMRWELGVDEDKVERMMGHAGKSVGEIHYDRPRDEYFAQTVADAYLRRRAG